MQLIDAINRYFLSSKFSNLSYSTKVMYERASKRLLDHFGSEMAIDEIKRGDVIEFREAHDHILTAARLSIIVLANVYDHLMDIDMAMTNPAKEIDISSKPKPVKRWTEAEVDKFLSMAPPHLRSAMLMALYTGQRKSDLVRMQWVHYDGKTIYLKQRKTGKELHVPVHPKLAADIAGRWPKRYATGRNNPYILANMQGDPWSPAALGKAITRFARRIGIKGKSIHGIRKTTASILAECGCSPNQIKAITGHSTLKEVERYTLEADQKRLANEAMQSWGGL